MPSIEVDKLEEI